jgi:hypothetical protein
MVADFMEFKIEVLQGGDHKISFAAWGLARLIC